MGKNKLKDYRFWESAYNNSANFRQYYDRFTELAISMFEWKGLPDTVDPRFLELVLFSYGKAVFFKDEVMGYLALPVIMQGKFNPYGIPKDRRAYSPYNNYSRRLKENNSVIIYNNMLHKNSMLDVQMFARRLYEIDRTIDVNVKAQKTPLLITCDETQRLAVQNLYKQYDGNEPVIFGDKQLSPNTIKVLSTNAPYNADKLYELRIQLWNEMLTYLGISNINVVKKERMITDEVTRNQGGTIASRYSRLEMRRQCCEHINKMFPELNVTCEYREDFKLSEEFGEKDGDDNGEIHDSSSNNM